jgi:hypothetical protein
MWSCQRTPVWQNPAFPLTIPAEPRWAGTRLSAQAVTRVLQVLRSVSGPPSWSAGRPIAGGRASVTIPSRFAGSAGGVDVVAAAAAPGFWTYAKRVACSDCLGLNNLLSVGGHLQLVSRVSNNAGCWKPFHMHGMQAFVVSGVMTLRKLVLKSCQATPPRHGCLR